MEREKGKVSRAPYYRSPVKGNFLALHIIALPYLPPTLVNVKGALFSSQIFVNVVCSVSMCERDKFPRSRTEELG